MQPEVPPAAVSSGMPQPGDQIADEYLVERTMGEGGMGVVLAARRRSDGTRVAVKMLRPEAAVQPESLTRFVREAQASAAIRSDHVARVFDVGTTIIGVPYIVMEYLDGVDFGQLLAERSWLPTAEAVDYMLQACEAVAHAHRLGIVHRDLKPANLFLTRKPDGSPLVKVIDFGISKITVPGADTALTATSFAFGTPMYMSPEQVRSTKHVDPRTDLWALGAILHEMLTGLPPFEGDSLPALSAAIIADPPRSLREARPDVPVALERAVHACLQKPVNARPATVLDFARSIAPYGSPSTSAALVAAIARVGAPTVPLMR
ncbi:MAG: serine/threonine protein kinase, partial [Myxococcales bacterium]